MTIPEQIAESLRRHDAEFGCWGMVTHTIDDSSKVDEVSICARGTPGQGNDTIARVSYMGNGDIKVSGSVEGLIRAFRLLNRVGIKGGPVDACKVRP